MRNKLRRSAGNVNSEVERATRLDGTAFYPVSIYTFVDKVTVCFKAPGYDVVKWLQRRCKLHEWWAAGPDPYERCFSLLQPTREVLAYLAKEQQVRVTGIELALDWTFDSEEERDRAYRIFCTYNIKKYCRGTEIYYETTRYTSRRRGRSNLVSYADKASKETGEVYCVHVEIRLRGRHTLEREGINVGNIDHHKFWRKHLKMSKIEDEEKLGRLLQKQGRRKPLISVTKLSNGREFVYNVDKRIGNMIMIAKKSTQAVIDYCRKKGIDIQHKGCVKAIDVEHLLPEKADVGDKINCVMKTRAEGPKSEKAIYIIERQRRNRANTESDVATDEAV